MEKMINKSGIMRRLGSLVLAGALAALTLTSASDAQAQRIAPADHSLTHPKNDPMARHNEMSTKSERTKALCPMLAQRQRTAISVHGTGRTEAPRSGHSRQ
jgi:hypothetical protein